MPLSLAPRSKLFSLVLAPLLVAIVACGGPPSAPIATTLSPGKVDSVSSSRAPFGIAFSGPRGEVADLSEPAITVLFNRAMRDPDSADTAGLPTVRLATAGGAPIAGAWRWVGTHGLLFTPTAPLPGSTRFSVTVASGTRSLEGESLTADYAFDFATPRAALVRTEPHDGAWDVRTDVSFVVELNQPMDPAVVATNAELAVVGSGTAGRRIVAMTAAHPKSGKHRDETVILTPNEKLPKDSALELVLAAGLHGAGPLPSKGARTLRFRTYGPLALTSVTCPHSMGPRCEAHRNFTVVLSNAVDVADFKAHLRAPELKMMVLPKPLPSLKKHAPPPTTALLVAADPDFGKRYHVTVTKGLRDVFGQVLDHDLSFDLDTEAPWSPDGAKPDPKASQGLSQPVAQGPIDPPSAPAVPHRLRLDYGVELGVQGHVVEALAKTGIKSHRVPISDVNVPTYGLFDEKLGEEDTLLWLEHRWNRGPSGADFRWNWVSPNAPENVRDVRAVDLDALLGGPGSRGAALLAIDLPGDAARKTSLLTVTDLGVSAEVSRLGSLVWVTHLSTGAPVAGAVVAVRGVPKAEPAVATTDASGIATFPPGKWFEGRDRSDGGEEPYFFVRAGDDWTFTKVARARASYQSGVDLDLKAEADWAGMIYADRGVYRPGETMKLAGVFRKVDAAGVTIVHDADARVLVEDSQGEKVFDGRAKLGAFGELTLDVPLSKTSHLGNASIKVELGRRSSQMFASEVLLAAYKASEFKVGVVAQQPAYVRGDTATFAIRGDFLFGAPMAGATYRASVLRRRSDFVPPHTEGFVTNDQAFATDHAEANPGASQLKDQEGMLDDTGHADASISLALPDLTAPEELTLEAEVTDLSQVTVAKRASVRVHPAAFYLGLADLPSRFVAIGADVPVRVAAFEALGTGGHVAGVAVKVTLLARTWTSATLDEAGDVPRRTVGVHDEVVGSCETVTTAGVATCKVHVGKPGYLLLRAEAKDARGNRVAASGSFYCMSDRSDAVVSWAPPSSSRRLSLETDKKTYLPGDVAKVLIQNPFSAAEALVTVERGGVLDQQVVELHGPMPTVVVPVKSSYFPNAFISVRLVRGRVADAPLSGADVGAPDFRLGLVPLTVDPASHRLITKVTTDRKEYEPGSSVLADVAVTDHDGKPARGEVTFYAVDEGVLMLTSYATPDPLPAFSQPRKLAVFSAESREDLAHVLVWKNGERVRPLGYEYLRPPGSEDKGGDGGGGGSDGPRFDFKTTAFFDAGKVTDAEGRVQYRFKLPDNLTTFRLMAIVAGADDRFGAGEVTLVTNKHLMARPVMPRIVRVGDRFEAGVLVSSLDVPTGMARVSVRATGVGVEGPSERAVTVPKGGSVEVRFPFVARAPGAASFTFAAEMARVPAALSVVAAKDSVTVERKIELPLSAETVSTYGEATGPVAIQLGDLTTARPDEGGLDVHVASTALVGLGSTFDRLIDYPYGCTEQLTSRILPLLVLPDLARAMGARLPAHVSSAVDDAIGKLLDHQDGNGGFSYWGGGEPEPWLSAYAMLAVEGAAQRGLFVPKDARERGLAFLRHVLDTAVPADDGLTQPEEESASEDDATSLERSPKEKRARAYADMAFIADTLATVGAGDPASADRLFEARATRPLFTQALLLHAMATMHRPVSQLDTLAKDIVGRVRVDGEAAYADEVTSGFADFLDSPTRTSALVLRALLAARPDHPLATRLARGLLARREGGAWRSTQENVWSLLALADYQKAQESQKPDFDAKVFLGSTKVLDAHFHGGATTEQAVSIDMRLVFPESGKPLTFDIVGQGKLFYAAELHTASAVLPTKPRDSGLFVQKIVRALRPDELALAQKTLPAHGDAHAAPGDLVLVDLLLESPEPREQVVIDDPLPAGLEPIDFALDTAAVSTRVHDDGPHADEKHKALFQYGVAFGTPSRMHREQRDDRVLTFLSHIDPGIYHFRYVARATTPGDFVVPPTRATCMYSPEVWGASAATRFVVSAGARDALAKRP